MRIRFRVLGVLVALFAFSASVAEGVRASTCAAMEMSAAAGHEGMSMPMEGMADGASSNTGQQDTKSPVDRDCPLPAVLGTGCIVISLPGATVRINLNAPERAGIPLRTVELSDRITVSNLFHPPQH